MKKMEPEMHFFMWEKIIMYILYKRQSKAFKQRVIKKSMQVLYFLLEIFYVQVF